MSGDPCKCGDKETWHKECYKTVEIPTGLTEREKWLMSHAFVASNNNLVMDDWLSDMAADSVTVEMVLAKDAPAPSCHSDEAVESEKFYKWWNGLITNCSFTDAIIRDKARPYAFASWQAAKIETSTEAHAAGRREGMADVEKIIRDTASDYCACEADRKCRACMTADSAIEVICKAAAQGGDNEGTR